MGAAEFEQRFSDLYLNDDTMWSGEEFRILDALFGDADTYVEDPDLRAEVKRSLDEGELRARAGESLTQLRDLVGRQS